MLDMFLRFFKEKAEIKKFREILDKRNFYEIPLNLDLDKIFKSSNREYLLVMSRCFFEVGKLDAAEKLNLKAHQILKDEYSFFNLMKIAYIKKDKIQLDNTFRDALAYLSDNTSKRHLEKMFRAEFDLMANSKMPLSFYDVVAAEKKLSLLIAELSSTHEEVANALKTHDSLEKISADNIYEQQSIRGRFFKAAAMQFGTQLSSDQKAKLFDIAHVLMGFYSPNKELVSEPVDSQLTQAFLLISR